MTITLDVNNIFSDKIGAHGLDRKVLNEYIATLDRYNRDLASAPYPFMKLPETRYQFNEMKTLSEIIQNKGIKNLVLLGIGSKMFYSSNDSFRPTLTGFSKSHCVRGLWEFPKVSWI